MEAEAPGDLAVSTTRREFLCAAAAAMGLPRLVSARQAGETLFGISIAQWSYHRAAQSGEMSVFEFPRVCLQDHGVDAVEYVSTLFPRKNAAAEAATLRRVCDALAVRSLLIMVDGEGALGDPDDDARALAVANHQKWLEAAAALGCHSIRVNAESRGERGEQERLAADGLRALCERAEPLGMNVLVENHWGLSSDPGWLMAVMKRVDHPRMGTLPDFGNFPAEQDRYEAVRAMMPLARAVSAKSHGFDEAGYETGTDYRRMLGIVVAAGYRGHVGIEYEGAGLAEREGVAATKRLLERVRRELEDAR